MRLCKEKPFNFYFGRKGHGPEVLAFAMVEKVFGGERTERQLREALWIKCLATPDQMCPYSSSILGTLMSRCVAVSAL